MNRIIKIIFFIFTFNTSVHSEIVNRVEINGNQRVSEETVKVYGGITSGKKDYSKGDLDNILKNIYETNFFENVTVEINENVLIINLKEYPVINQLILIGEKSKRIDKLKNYKFKRK